MTPHKKKEIILVTQTAAQKIKKLMQERTNTCLGIKIDVIIGGCSGLRYSFEYVETLPKEAYEKVSQHGINLFIPTKALLYLVGTELDYLEHDFRSGFVFKNPNAKAKCNCGDSFNV